MEIAVILWFATGAALAPFSYALTFGDFQGSFPPLADRNRVQDMAFSTFIAILTFGVFPLFLVPFFLSGYGKHGLKWK